MCGTMRGEWTFSNRFNHSIVSTFYGYALVALIKQLEIIDKHVDFFMSNMNSLIEFLHEQNYKVSPIMINVDGIGGVGTRGNAFDFPYLGHKDDIASLWHLLI